MSLKKLRDNRVTLFKQLGVKAVIRDNEAVHWFGCRKDTQVCLFKLIRLGFAIYTVYITINIYYRDVFHQYVVPHHTSSRAVIHHHVVAKTCVELWHMFYRCWPLPVLAAGWKLPHCLVQLLGLLIHKYYNSNIIIMVIDYYYITVLMFLFGSESKIR